MLARQAASHLDTFGDRAALLRALASFVVARRS
jgi:farnesyl diphosphate synthase